MPTWAIVLLCLGVVFCLMILPAIAIPMFLNQRDMAREAGVKEGVHSIQIGVQTWAVDNGDVYPDTCGRTTPTSGGSGSPVGTYVTYWPTNPFTEQPMTEGTDPGDYAYTVSPDGTDFTLVGYGADGQVVITAP